VAQNLSSKADSSVLRDQQELIKTLNEEKKANDKKFDVLTKAIEGLKPVQNDVNEPHCHDCRSTADEADCDSRVVRFDYKESDIYQKRVSSKIIVLKVWNLANRSIVLSPEPFEHVPVYEDLSSTIYSYNLYRAYNEESWKTPRGATYFRLLTVA
jgi:hypothetical protein